MITKKMTVLPALLVCAAYATFPSSALSAVEKTTECFKLSVQHAATRASTGSESLRYSSLWDGGTNQTAKVTLSQNGTTLAEDLTGEDTELWSASQNGTYNLTHTTYTNGEVAAVLNATFVVTGKDIPFPAGDVVVTGHNGKYDGDGHGISVTAPDGAMIRYARSAEGPFGVNPSFTNACGATTIWCEVTKAGYIPYTNSATVVIAKREVTLTSGSDSKTYNGIALTNWTHTVSGDGFVKEEGISCSYTGSQTEVGSSKNTIDYVYGSGTSEDNYVIKTVEGTLEVVASEIVNPFDPDDPTKPVTPEDLAKANCATNYNGDGHSIEVVSFLNPLIAANNPQITYSLLRDGSYEAQKPVFTNVVSTSVWYRISADNFNSFTTNALLIISPRSIANATAATIADQIYTGSAIEPMPDVTDMRTLIGMSEPTNIIASTDYDLSYLNNTNVGTAKIVLTGKNNYEGVQTNTFQIVPAIIPPGPTGAITVTGYTNAYDGAEHGVSVVASGLKTTPTIQYKSSATAEWQDDSPTYKNVCDTQVWWKVSAQNYQSVEGTIGLKISQAENGWTTIPAIEGWTYGETAKDPVGAAKFGEVVFSYDPTPVGNAGDYTMTARVDGTADYTALTKDVSFTIAKKTIPGGGEEPGEGKKPAGGLSKYDVTAIYDGDGHSIDTNKLIVAFKGVISGDGETRTWYVRAQDGNSAIAPTSGWCEVAPVFTNACVETIWYKVTNPNYEDYVHAAKVMITNRPVTVRSADASWPYDTLTHGTNGVDVTSGSFVGEDGIVADDASFPTLTNVGSKENTFTWSLAEGTLATNYALTVEYGTIEVTPRVLDGDPDKWDIRLGGNLKYDGTEQTVTITQVAFIKPDGNLEMIPYTVAGNKGTDSGNYKAEITGTGNYAGTVTNAWAILPRNVTLTSVTTNWVYDATEHVADEIVISDEGFVSGEGVDCTSFPKATHVADAATPTENSFTYELTGAAKDKNYVIKPVYGTIQVSKRPITLTGPTMTREYNGSPHTYTAADIVDSAIGYAGNERFTLGGFKSQTEAGSVATTFTVADGTALLADYTVTSVPGMLTVKANASEITVTARSKSWTYDGLTHTLHEYDADNLSVLTAGDELEVTFEESSVAMTPVDGPNADGVVENKIKSVRVIRGGTKDVSDNYTLGKVSGTLTVTKRPVTLTSKSASRAYDGTELTAHEVEVGGDKFVDGEGATYSYTGSQKDVGTSDNTFSYTLNDNTKAAYYTITKVVGKLTVTEADISGGDEGDWVVVLAPSPTYNGQPQVQTLASVTFKGLTVDYSLSDYQQTDAGNYTLKVTGKGNFTGERLVPWTLAPKALTLTAGSGSKIYDGTDLTVGTVTESGFVAGEGATYVCAGAQRDVGSSANEISTINWNDGTKSTNYAVSKNKGTLTVTERPVIVKSKDITKPWDGTPLELTADDITETYNGGGQVLPALPSGESFVYGDFAERTEAGQTSGTFTVTAGPNTKLTNYTITPEYGKITITKSATEIGVTANSESWIYDGEIHSNRTYTATNLETLLDTDKLQVAFDESCIVTTPHDGLGGDGKVENRIASVKVIRNGTDDVTGNYTIGIYPGLISVTKRPVSIAVKGKTKSVTYDGEEHTVKGYDISTEDTLYKLTDTTFSGTDEVKGTNASTYDMGLEAGDFTNGNDCFDVTYLVSDGKLTIGKADISSDAGADCEIVLGSNPMYNGTSQTIPVTSVTYKELPVTYELKGQTAVNASESILLTVTGTGNFTGEKTTTWKILKRKVTMTSKSATKTYDGTALTEETVTVTGDGFVGVEGANYAVTGQQLTAGSSKNTFTYELKAGTFESNYDISTVFGDLVVNKAQYPGQEPGGAGITWNVTPAAATWMYDGSEHGVVVTGVPTGVTPVYVDNKAKGVGTYTASVTFLYDAENYEAPVGPSPMEWSITARPITLSALSKERPYNGLPYSVLESDITASGNGYAPGEKFEYYDYASITDVGEKPATFKYRDSTNAKVSNYVVTITPGKIIKVTVGGDQISVTSDSATWAYDGNAHGTNGWTFVNRDKLLAGHEFQIKIADSSAIETPKDGPSHDGVVSNAFEYVRIIETATGNNMTKNYNLFVYEGVLKMTNACIRADQLSGTDKIEKTYDGDVVKANVSATLLQPATVKYGNSEDDITLVASPEFTHVTNAVVWFAVTADYYHTYTGKVEISIGKRPITISTPTLSKPYDGTPLTFGESGVTISGDGFATGEGFVYSNFASISNAGKTDATCSYAADAETLRDDYVVTENWGTLTVLASADQITVTAKNGEWTYTGNPQMLHEYVAENEDKLTSGDKLSVAFSEQSVITNPDDGPLHDGIVSNVITSVKVMRGDVDVTKNYSLAWYPGVLKMKNATMTVDDSTFATTHVYDGKGHTANVVAPTLLTSPVTVKYGTSSDAVTSLVSPAFKDAGTHTVFYQISAKYYNVYSGSTTVKITPRPVTLVSAGAERVYDGSPLTKDEVSVKTGSLDFPDGDGYTATCYGTITGVGAVENGFNYALTGAAKNDNYVITKEYGELRVTYATLDPSEVIGPMPVPMNQTYDGGEHPFAVTPTFAEAYKMYYAAVPQDESAYSEALIKFKNATAISVPVYFKMVTDNYHPLYGTGTVTVAARPVTFSSASAKKMYDGTPLMSDLVTVGGMGFVSGESFDFDVTGTITDAGTAKNVFSYTPASGTLAANYSVTKDEGTLEVTKRPVTLTSATASKKFDGTPLVAKTVTVSGDGWAAEEGATYDVTGTQTAVGSAQNAFTYTLTNGAKEQNYTIIEVEGTLTVTEGDIVYTAQDSSTEYDGEGHSIAVAVTTPSGLVPKYALTQGGPYSATVPTFTNVCTDVVVWYALEADQYASVTNFAKVTITKRPLTAAMVNTIADQTYTGSEIKPTLSFTDAGNRKITTGDYSAVYSNNKNVGQATVTVTATAAGNYSGEVTIHFNIVKATYDMSKAKWSSDAGFIYDGSEKSVTVSGLPDGVTVASYADNKKIHAGNYTASVTFDYDTVNYKTPVLADKEWSIGKRSVTIKSQSASKEFDGSPLVKHGVDVISGSFISGEGLDYSFTGSQSVVGESPNTYTYTFKSSTLSTDYAVTQQTGTLTVVEGGIVYTAQGYAGEYDGEGHFIDIQVASPAGLMPRYALAKNGPYATSHATYTNVCEDIEVWYVLEASGYTSITNSAKVKITPRTLTAAMVNEISDQTYTGSPITPALSFTDEGNRKIEAEDYAATYSDNTVVGTASVKITGKRNYAGEVTVKFKIVKANYDMSGAKWDYTSAFTYDRTEKTVSVTGLPSGVTTKAITDGKKTHAGDYVAKVTFNYDTANYNEPKLADCSWKINKKALAVTADAKTQTFGKAELPLTYKAPALCSGDTLSGALVRDSGTNVGKYAIKLGTLANADYTITFTGAIYEIVKAKINDGNEPGSGSVPAGGDSKFDKTFEYDGKGHTIDAATILAAFKGVVVGGVAECKYALSATPAVWLNTPPVFTNVCTKSIWYRATAANYEDFVHEVRLTIKPRDIAKATIAPIPDITYADKPATPVPVVTDGTPSIITANDYTVSYLNNAKPGTATVTLTGKGNYTGTKSANFTIKAAGVKYAALKGTLAWKLNTGTGCYTAQLKLTCTNGFDQGISDLKFVYQDRMNGTKVASGLWNSSTRAYRPTTTIGGTTYRYVALDASKISALNVTALYGVQDVSKSVGTVPAAQCTIELYVSNLASPVSDIGYVMWKSNGAQCSLPISAAGGSQGMTVSQTMLKTVRMAASASLLGAPLSTAALNTSLAMGVVIDPASSPYCKLTDFTVDEGGISGRVEVGKEMSGVETQGSLGANARAVLMGAKNLTDGFSEIGSVPIDDSGAFQFYLGSKDYQFFRVRIDIQNVVE